MTLPDELVGKPDELLAKDMHGCAVELGRGERDQRFVMSAYSDFNAVGHEDASDAADALTEPDEGEKITVLERTQTKLGEFPAIRLRLISAKTDDSGAEEVIKEIIVAVRSDGSRTDRLYSLTLVTIESRHEKDVRVFEQLVRSWQALPLPQE